MISEKELFNDIVYSFIKRDGINDLMSWLQNTDFYIAPASARYHGNFDGGLLRHSIEVWDRLVMLAEHYNYNISSTIIMESLSIISLFHDVCKIGMYKKGYRNVKNDLTGKWERVECYQINDENNVFYSHGAYSMYLVSRFIRLEDFEASAILHHMGAWDKSQYSDPGKVYERNPYAWLLHIADEAATYLSKI